MGVRRLRSLVYGLPAESSTMQELGAYVPSHNSEELLAELIELVDESNRLFYDAHTKKHAAPLRDPITVPRPWRRQEQIEKRPATAEEIRDMFGGGGHIIYTPKELETT